MKVLIIGGCGFIGSHVLDILLQCDVQVRVLDCRSEMFRPPVQGVEYFIGDFSNSALLIEALLGVDAVLHLASSTVPSTSNVDPVKDIDSNLIGAVRLLEAMRSTGVRNIVYMSSGGTVYGIPLTDPVAEGHPLQPVSSYGIVKAAVEMYMHFYCHLYGLRTCVLRASNPFGPRQGHAGVQGVIGTFLWKVAHDEAIEVWGDGSVVRDFIFVRDLAELCALALTSDVTGVFNAGSGVGMSIAEVVTAVAHTVGRELDPLYKQGRAFDVQRVVLDISRAKAAFGWAPRTSFELGVAETWAWVQSRIG